MNETEDRKNSKIAPVPTIRRIPSYLRILYEYRDAGREWISATEIAERLFLKSIQVRKDMAFTGIVGKPKKGFPVNELIAGIREFLGWNSINKAILVGAGALGSALLGYSGFTEHGLDIVAVFDKTPEKIGRTVHGREILPMSRIRPTVSKRNIRIAIITVPASAAQEVADELVAAGIEGIWNFSPVKLNVPPRVAIQREDLSSGLAVLCVKLGAGAEE